MTVVVYRKKKNNKAAGSVTPAVTFDGAVVERTNHLRLQCKTAAQYRRGNQNGQAISWFSKSREKKRDTVVASLMVIICVYYVEIIQRRMFSCDDPL